MGVKRQTVERSWVLVSLFYGLFRATLVWKFLAQYGVNTVVFLVVELTSSGIYGLASARLVGAIVDSDWKKLRRWIPGAVASYAAPDAYVFASAGRLPGNMFEILLSIVAVTATLSAVGIFFQVRSKRREK